MLAWATDAAMPLRSLDPAASDASDLEPLFDAIGDARVVVLSEGFHNCAEMMRLHERIVRHLVAHHGFNTVVTESGLPESRLIHDYVKGGPMPSDMWRRGINKMYGAWQEGRSLIEWMRAHSEAIDRPLSYYGADIAGFYTDWRPAYRQLRKYLHGVDSGCVELLDRDVLPLLEIMGDDARPRFFRELTPAQRDLLAARLDAAVSFISSNRDAYVAKSDPESYSWAKQTAIAMQLAENYYTNWAHRREPATSQFVGLNGREIAMARGVLWALAQRDDAKVIVINHVVHTKTKSQYQGPMWGHFTPMGQLLRQELGDEMFVVGMAYGGGEFWNRWQRPAEREVAAIPEAKEDGIERVLGTVAERIGAPNFVLVFDGAPQRWLREPIVIRENDYFITLEPGEWDAIVYLDRVGPATVVR